MNQLRNIVSSTLAAAIVAIVAAEQHGGAQAIPTTEITFCGDTVPARVSDANATFELFYELKTDAAGKTTTVTKLRNNVLPDERFVNCLKRWTLPVANATVKISARWEHAKGWTRFSIAIPGHPVRHITIEPGWPF